MEDTSRAEVLKLVREFGERTDDELYQVLGETFFENTFHAGEPAPAEKQQRGRKLFSDFMTQCKTAICGSPMIRSYCNSHLTATSVDISCIIVDELGAEYFRAVLGFVSPIAIAAITNLIARTSLVLFCKNYWENVAGQPNANASAADQ